MRICVLQSDRFSYDRIADLTPKDDFNIPIPTVDVFNGVLEGNEDEPAGKKRKLNDLTTDRDGWLNEDHCIGITLMESHF